jgi:ComF family protein
LLRELFGALLDLLYPSYCLSCGKFLFLDHYFVACKECWEEGFREFKGKRCLNCGHPLELLPGVGELCGRCLEKPRKFNFDGVFYYTLYEGLPEVAIRELKFSRYRPVAGAIGRTISPHLKEVIRKFKPHLIVPVPLHPESLKERGFNQTEEILRGAGVPFEPILEKPYRGKKQAWSSYTERRENVKGLYRLKEGAQVFGRRILLFDDVFTTGATADEIASLLKEKGATEILVYAVAYTPKGREGRQPGGFQLRAGAPP